MRRREFLLQSGRAAIGCALLPLAGCAGRRSAATAFERYLEGQVPRWMEEAAVPGVGIAIIENAALAWHGSFGVRDAASDVRVDGATMFEAASMSKPVFAYVVMKLCEAGVMDLDTPLTEYTTERFLEGDARLMQITARHVLSHTTGFQNWRSEQDPLRIHFTPGERYQYSGEGYNYLQTVVTRLLGQDFETYMRTRLLEPMGMTSSGYAWTEAFARRMTRPHDEKGTPMENKKSTAADVARYGSAGALLTTPEDYARFLVAVIDPPPADEFHLSRDGVAEMLRPHVKVEGGQFPASWALGWQIFTNGGRDFLYHGGDNEGFHCFALASAPGRRGLVVMTNAEGGTTLLRNVVLDAETQRFLGVT